VEPGLTAAELVSWFGRLRGGHEQRIVDGLCQRLDLDPHRRFGTLSKGNRQKVGILQALFHRPDLLILDEPSTGLDPIVQREFLTLLREAADRGTAVLFSSHVLPEVERAATHVAIIRAGRLVTSGTVSDLLDHARRRMELRYTAPPPATAFHNLPGVVDVAIDGATVVLTVDGPVGPALSAAAGAGTLLRVAPAGDDLENLFVAVYSDPGQPVEVR
jgi:ABC-2 type transport system ATP-binding protein